MGIEVRHITRSFGTHTALDDVSLTFPDGELTALLGPSGCGKTTLLRIIAGLERADRGQVLLDGEDASARPVRERQVGFVFQHYALFKHMTVFENVAFGLRVRPRAQRPDEGEIRKRVLRLLDLVQLGGLADRFPPQLSGGQRQRVALARALAIEPRVLLLDEPFGALDAQVRKELRRWLRRLHDELHITSVLVTHDQEEALEVAGRVVVMNGGRVEQVGAPDQVYNQPASPFVYRFLGQVNVFSGHVRNGTLHTGEAALPLASAGVVASGASSVSGAPGLAQADGYVRPHDLEIRPFSKHEAGVPAILRRALALGPIAQLEMERADTGETIEVAVPAAQVRDHAFSEGQTLLLQPRRLQIFASEAG